MRRATLILVGSVILGSAVTACGDDDDDDNNPAADAQAVVCDARVDLGDDISEFVTEVKAGNLGNARDELSDVRESLGELRSALGDLTSAQREAIQPQVDAISTVVDSADITNIRALGETVDSIGAQVNSALDELAANSALDCP